MTLKEIIARLPLVDNNILEEAARQPVLFAEAAYCRVDAMRRRAMAVAKLERFRCRLALAIRANKDSEGGKITEGHIKEKIEVHSTTKKLRDAMERAYEDEELAKAIIDTLRQRRDAIRQIAEARLYESTPNEVEKAIRRKQSLEARNVLDRGRHHEED